MLPIISTSSTHYNYILATNKKIHINVNKWPEVGRCQVRLIRSVVASKRVKQLFRVSDTGRKLLPVFGRPG